MIARTRFVAMMFSVASCLFGGGCERAEPSVTGQPLPTLESIESEIFATSCALSGCHTGAAAPFGLDLSAGQAGPNLIGIPSAEVPDLLRVRPGNPDDSYLIIKLEGGTRIAPGTGRMPLGRQPLPAQQIEAIREWIAAGAMASGHNQD